MRTGKAAKTQTKGKISLIKSLFCGDGNGPPLTPEQEQFLTVRAKLENRLPEILRVKDPEELKQIEEYGLTGMAEEWQRMWEELIILNENNNENVINMKTRQDVLNKQIAWAKNENLDLGANDYLTEWPKNFFKHSLNDETERDFRKANGSEFIAKDGKLPKICALHSSAALVCNVFDYWRNRDKSPLKKALGLDADVKAFTFEQKLTMGMVGSPPNLDLFIVLENGFAVAVESKFTEWMTKSSKANFSASYFDGSIRWEDVGLPHCQRLACKIFDDGKTEYHYLDAPQLLKHALGLANTHSSRSTLLYLYFDLAEDSDDGKEHREEIERFRNEIGDELNFRALTYQEVFGNMKRHVTDQGYLGYLGKRYF